MVDEVRDGEKVAEKMDTELGERVCLKGESHSSWFMMAGSNSLVLLQALETTSKSFESFTSLAFFRRFFSLVLLPALHV